MTRLIHICCGQQLSPISIERDDVMLRFTFCPRCDAIQWFRGDAPLGQADADLVAHALPMMPRGRHVESETATP